jgi:hypothetical protein
MDAIVKQATAELAVHAETGLIPLTAIIKKRQVERDDMKLDGACACSAIQIEGEGDPAKVQICHCTDCQSGSGSAFRVSIPMPGASFKMIGQPTIYLKTTADSGNPRAQAFCPTCGSPIYSTTPGDGVQPSYTVRVGILRQRDQLIPQKQNWFRSARPWVTDIAAIRKNDKQAPA